MRVIITVVVNKIYKITIWKQSLTFNYKWRQHACCSCLSSNKKTSNDSKEYSGRFQSNTRSLETQLTIRHIDKRGLVKRVEIQRDCNKNTNNFHKI